MREVTYRYTIQQITAALINTEELEDGFWELNFALEVVPGTIPKIAEGNMMDGSFPGMITRITGAQLVRHLEPTPNCLQIKNGIIMPQIEEPNGIHRDNSGSVPSGVSPGENSGSTGKNSSSTRSGRTNSSLTSGLQGFIRRIK